MCDISNNGYDSHSSNGYDSHSKHDDNDDDVSKTVCVTVAHMCALILNRFAVPRQVGSYSLGTHEPESSKEPGAVYPYVTVLMYPW